MLDLIGGAAIGGHGDLAESEASKTDKLVGKTQKVGKELLSSTVPC